jgi:hypothetical protein
VLIHAASVMRSAAAVTTEFQVRVSINSIAPARSWDAHHAPVRPTELTYVLLQLLRGETVKAFTLPLVLVLASCVSVPESQSVRVIGGQHPAPTGCQELGPVQLSGASLLNDSPIGSPNDEMLREMTLAKGGDTLHYTGVFPLRGVAYKCGGAIAAAATPVAATPAVPNAAPVPASRTPAPTVAPSAATTVANVTGNPPTGNPADRLTKLDALYKSGLITKDEYDRKRQEILSGL